QPVFTQFEVPNDLPDGHYQLCVVANGIASKEELVGLKRELLPRGRPVAPKSIVSSALSPENVGVVRNFSVGAAGLWLMVLIAFAVATAIVIFSATQFQVRISNLSLGGAPLTIWKAEQMRAQWVASLDGLAAARQTLNQSQQAWAKNLQDQTSA